MNIGEKKIDETTLAKYLLLDKCCGNCGNSMTEGDDKNYKFCMYIYRHTNGVPTPCMTKITNICEHWEPWRIL